MTDAWKPTTLLLKIGKFSLSTSDSSPRLHCLLSQTDSAGIASCEWASIRAPNLVAALIENGQLPSFLYNTHVRTAFLQHFPFWRSKFPNYNWDRTLQVLAEHLGAHSHWSFICNVRRPRLTDATALRVYQYVVLWINRDGDLREEGFNQNQLLAKLEELGQSAKIEIE